ncbi:MAG: DNA-binding response regulator, partial [Flavobacteriales bacterium]|nr:DNA-binding response regulator [Flavobacteriales bacterium]
MSSTVDLKVIILEDEAIASRRLGRLLKEIPDKNIEIIKIFVTVEALIEYLEKNDHPDVLLLDIMVADGSSFELFE